MPEPRAPDDRRAAARRALGRALPIVGWALVVGNVLVMTGLVPLWRPSLPPPDILVPAGPAGPAATGPGWSLTDWVAFAAPRAAPGPSAAPAEAAPPPLESATPGAPLAADAGPSYSPIVGALAPVATAVVPLPTSTPVVLPTPVPPLPPPGRPLQLTIPSIRVDTPVVELHTTIGPNGALEWDTVPFVAGHYSTSGLAGAPTNVVLSGHVMTTDRGNVFRDLYRVRPGEPLIVWTEQGQFTYRVVDVRLARPNDLSLVAPTTSPRLTLITCAGQFDYRTQTFTERLVVVGEFVTA
jgi:LPXTG-site transpeptidase (sortase) family protein